MGHAIGTVLRENGLNVVTCLNERGGETKRLALKAGIHDLPNLDELVVLADLILSVIPPKSAFVLADNILNAVKRTGSKPVFAECNAISPSLSRKIASHFISMNILYIDAGIIGPPPTVGKPSIYVSGMDTSCMEKLPGLHVIPLGFEVGRASALKMCFSAFNKGINALAAAVLFAAERLDIYSELEKELLKRQQDVFKRIEKQVPFLPLNAERWVEEMKEISKTMFDAGSISEFHNGAALLYELMAATPFSKEVRDTFDKTRTAHETIRGLKSREANYKIEKK